jgi:hypothetical protein
MRIVLAGMLALVVTASAQAQTQSYFLHHSDTPVPIPGGTTISFLDVLAPTATLPLAAEQIVAAGATESFPTFTAPAFAADTPLAPIASVRLHLAANQQMRECGSFATELFKVDGLGGFTSIGTATVTGATISQGSSGGTVGFSSHLIEFPITDTSVLSGQGIALATSFTNQCQINRRVFFAYDGSSAPTRVRFQCCMTVAARCAKDKINAVGANAACLLGAKSHGAATGDPTDPAAVLKCQDKFFAAFAKAEDRGGCLTIGDAPLVGVSLDAFVADIDGSLNPLGPPSKNKCQAAKLKLAAKTTKCLFALESKAAAKGQFLEPDAVKAQKCRDVFAWGFAKFDGKGGCDTMGDAATIEAKVDAFVAAVSLQLACPCP